MPSSYTDTTVPLEEGDTVKVSIVGAKMAYTPTINASRVEVTLPDGQRASVPKTAVAVTKKAPPPEPRQGSVINHRGSGFSAYQSFWLRGEENWALIADSAGFLAKVNNFITPWADFTHERVTVLHRA